MGGMTTVCPTVLRRCLRTRLGVEGGKGITEVVTQIGEKVLARLLQTVHGIGLAMSRTIIG